MDELWYALLVFGAMGVLIIALSADGGDKKIKEFIAMLSLLVVYSPFILVAAFFIWVLAAIGGFLD